MKPKRSVGAMLPALLVCLIGNGACHAQPAPGPYIQPFWTDFTGPSFSTTDYLVATYYFYWYDVFTTAHIINPDGSDALTDHPANSQPVPVGPGGYAARPPATYFHPPWFSFQDPAWHAQEVQRIMDAGIDFLLPVYWGVPGIEDWSNAGLRQLEKAMNLLEDHKTPTLHPLRLHPPAVGLFYDTTTLNGVDLTTQAGKDRLYKTIRDFYSLVPPRRWARLDNRAIVWLYWSGWPSHIAPTVLSEASNRFAAEFGGVRLFFVGDDGWRNAGATLDRTYSWGAAVSGTTIHEVTAVGAGYDDRGVTGRSQHTYADRQNGAFYQNNWGTAHASGRRLIVVETWNEFHEGTEIAPSFEYGWLYHTLTAQESTRHRFPSAYVRQAYLYLLRHAADPSGYQTYTTAMDGGMSPAAVRDALLNSSQAKAVVSNTDYVTFLYNHYLGRAPDPGGFANWVGVLDSGGSRALARDSFLDSPEAQAKISDKQFVRMAYGQLLKREPDSGGFNYWTQQLALGKPRHWVREGFINSVEIRYRDLTILSAPDRMALFDFAAR